MDSIYDLSRGVNAGQDFYILLGDFLDGFYRAAPDVRAEMLRDEPENMRNAEFVPFLAATAHKLANDCGLPAPKWAFERRCYLPGAKPYFACGAQGNLRLLFMYKSPAEFKHRNLFVDENVLARIAEREGLPRDWLNDSVKGFVGANAPVEEFRSLGNLLIQTVSAEYLLAMKMMSARYGEKDSDDIFFLMNKLEITTVERATEILLSFFPRDRILPKTQYVIEEMIERIRVKKAHKSE
jgi:hypothetical protein